MKCAPVTLSVCAGNGRGVVMGFVLEDNVRTWENV